MKAKRILSLLLAVLMLVFPLASCGGGDETTTTVTTTTAPTVTTSTVIPTPPPAAPAQSLAKKLLDEGFVFVGAENAVAAVESAANAAIQTAKDVAESKWDVSVADDYLARESGKKEIHFGKIRRNEATAAYNALYAARVNASMDWRVTVTADTVSVIGGSDDALVLALNYFTAMMKADAASFYPSYDTGIQNYGWPLVNLGGVGIENYKIVVAAGADAAYQSAATVLQEKVFAASGFTLSIVDDSTAAAACELVVGQTSRSVSASAMAALRAGRKNCAYDGVVLSLGNQIAISGGGMDAINIAINQFAVDYLSASSQSQMFQKLYQKAGIKSLSFGTNDAGDYRIVHAEGAPFDLRYVSHKLQALLYEQFGYRLEIVTDATPAVAGQKEILLGKTNRPASTTLAVDAYAAKVDANGNVVFDAGNYVGVQKMYAAMLTELDAQSGDTLTASVNYSGTVTDIPLTWTPDMTLTWDMDVRLDDYNNKLNNVKTKTFENADTLEWFDPGAEYVLAWNDEFDGTGIDLEKWSHTHSIASHDVKPTTESPWISQSGGQTHLMATITKKDEPYQYQTHYSLVTADTMNFSGGYLEMRGKVPMHGQGEFPSFWTTSSVSALFKQAYRQKNGGQLPVTGYYVEVDIFENFSTTDTLQSGLLKWYNMYDFGGTWSGYCGLGAGCRADSSITRGQKDYFFPASEDPNDWHTFGFLWTDEMMSFSVDGRFYWSVSITDKQNTNDAWEKFNPTYIVRKEDSIYGEVGDTFTLDMKGYQKENMALSVKFDTFLYCEGTYGEGSKINHANDDTFFPIRYDLDYVRLYQCADDDIYTRTTFGDTSVMYDMDKWVYALQGTGTPVVW